MSSLNNGRIEVVGAEVDKTTLITTITGQITELGKGIIGGFFPDKKGSSGSTTPSWMLPVIIGGVGVLAVTIIATNKKKK